MDNTTNTDEPLLEPPKAEELLAPPPEEQLLPAHTGNNKKPMIIRVLASIMGLALIGAICFTIYTLLARASNAPTQKSAPTPTKTAATNTPIPTMPSIVPSDWLEYSSTEAQYSIFFPSHINSNCYNPYSCQFSGLTSLGNGPASLVYVSVIPSNVRLADGSIYNYDASESAILSTIKTGETKTTRPSPESKELETFYRYKRLPDTRINNHTAKVFENSRPWEFPSGTKELRYIITNDTGMYMIGAYTHPDGITEEIARTIIGSFHFGN